MGSPPVNTPETRLQLVGPTIDFEASHRSYLQEVRAAGEEFIPWVVGLPSESFADYVDMLRESAVTPAEGFVPHSTFWLVAERDIVDGVVADGVVADCVVEDGGERPLEIVAVANLRHSLNEKLLRHGGHIGYGVRPSARRRGFATTLLRLVLAEARQLGLQRALVACDEGNIGSRQAILRNGGVLERAEKLPELGCLVERYWIDLGVEA